MTKWPLFLTYYLYNEHDEFVGSMDIQLLYDTEAEMKIAYDKYSTQVGEYPDLYDFREFLLVYSAPGTAPYGSDDDFPIT